MHIRKIKSKYGIDKFQAIKTTYVPELNRGVQSTVAIITNGAVEYKQDKETIDKEDIIAIDDFVKSYKIEESKKHIIQDMKLCNTCIEDVLQQKDLISDNINIDIASAYYKLNKQYMKIIKKQFKIDELEQHNPAQKVFDFVDKQS